MGSLRSEADQRPIGGISGHQSQFGRFKVWSQKWQGDDNALMDKCDFDASCVDLPIFFNAKFIQDLRFS